MKNRHQSDCGAPHAPRLIAAVGLVGAAILGSCTEVPTSPETRTGGALNAPSLAVEAPRGCTRITVRLRGRDSILVEPTPPAPTAECGTVRPVLAGAPQFDRAKGLIRLPVAMQNAGTRAVRAPARIFAWDDSTVVVAPRGLEGHPRQAMVDFLGADSLLASDAPAFRSAEAWIIDTLLAPAGEPPRLAAGAESLVRWIELSVHPGVVAFETVLWAEAQPVALSWPVPETPTPTTDSVWAAVSAPANIVDDGEGGRWIWNAMYVRFNEGTARDVKQALFDSIGAHAVGGFSPGPVGFYLVTLDAWAATTPEGALGRLLELANALRAHPEVAGVMTIELTPPEMHSLLPKDAGHFASWATRREDANGLNWGLEAIRAPLAWGCDVGAQAPRVAVVDRDFRPLSEIDYPNARVKDFGQSVEPAFAGHGSAVASILGAKGNNQVGMTGVLWNTPLELYDIGVPGGPGAQPDPVPVTWPYWRIAAALKDSAKVINLSLGLVSFPSTVNPTMANPNHVERVTTAQNALESVLAPDVVVAHDPLFVVAAGNRPLALYWTGWQTLAELSYTKSRLMVVAAVERADTTVVLWQSSGRDTLVNIAAPGVNVGVLAANGNVIPGTGTSFAAPHVSGVAGLLRSFDPTLTADSTRKLILAGAGKGGRTVAGDRPIPVLDAYGALKAAAEGRGTRLCGNRVWHDGSKVTASRGNHTEVLFTDATADIEYLNVHHGGRTIDLEFDRRFTRAPSGSWTEVPYQSAPADSSGGSFWGALGISHSFDRQLVASGDGTGVSVSLRSAAGQLAATQLPIPVTGSSSMTCIRLLPDTDWVLDPVTKEPISIILKGYVCGDSLSTGSTQQAGWPTAALSSDARYALVAVTMRSHTTTVTGESVCPGYAGAMFAARCFNGTTTSTASTSRIYRVPMVNGGAWTLIHEVPGEVGWLSISEDESEFAFSSSARTESSTWSYTELGWFQVVGGPTICSSYAVSYVSLPAPGTTVAAKLLARHPYANPTGCAGNDLVTGGFSSDRRQTFLPVKP